MNVDMTLPFNTDLNNGSENMYLKISNTGEISANALRLMGATTKRGDDSQIGYFGTGNKYALAWLLKNDVPIRIFSGLNEIVIGTNLCEFGGQSFSVITIDGAETSLTTDMGPSWEAWEIVREIYCNAIDAGDAEIECVETIEPDNGITKFYIQLAEPIQDVMDNFNDYFSANRQPLFENEIGRIYPRENGIIYRKGIRCTGKPLKSAFDYDFNSIELNENRRVAYSWTVNEKAWELISASENPMIFAEAVRQSCVPGSIESDLSYADLPSPNHNWETYFTDRIVATPEMRQLMTERERLSCSFVHSKILSKAQDALGSDAINLPKSIDNSQNIIYRRIETTPFTKQMLSESISFLSEAGIQISYPISVVAFEDKRLMGLADSKHEAILIAETTFTVGKHQVIATLLEEYIHIKHGVHDETRAMQDAILNEFVLCVQGLLNSDTFMEKIA